MYNWRKMTEEQRKYVLQIRKEQHFPLHSLPHFSSETGYYHISVACYEHKPIIARNIERISQFEKKLFEAVAKAKTYIYPRVLIFIVLLGNYEFNLAI